MENIESKLNNSDYKQLDYFLEQGFKAVRIDNRPGENGKFLVRLEKDAQAQVVEIPDEYNGDVSDQEAFKQFIKSKI